ncbi:MAG TPA: hypothetical protein VFT99_13330, partial [Roseiflexaceae bacterium]|nr:hypothetical protein [Roseiflexaceae bacterium]
DAEGSVLPAKSTVVIAGQQADLWYLLGLLNSAPASRLYRAMFGGLALAGGYVRIGAPQLRQLPVPRLTLALPEAERAQSLAHALALFEGGKDAVVLADATACRAVPDLARDLLAALARQRASQPGLAQRLDMLIDALALWLYES